MSSRRSFGACAFALLLSGCFLVPNHSDAKGPGEFLERTQREPECDHVVEVVNANTNSRPYQELSRISVTCHPSSREICERRLRARGCELGADAVVLLDSDADGTAKMPNSQSQIAQSALAIRYK